MSTSPSGVEIDAPLAQSAAHQHLLLIQAVLQDRTDHKAEILEENEWILHPSEGELSLQGNAFALENVLDESGTVFLKLAPPPHARPEPVEWDLRVAGGQNIELNRADGYEWAEIAYQNGKWGRIAAVHRVQRQKRPYNPEQDGLLLTNTWGDRNRDARIAADFMALEVEAGARLGADIIQIDDGWQVGITANSARAEGGAWNGFWDSNPDFWQVNRERFPDGLEPLILAAREKGLRFGLWFAPDTSGDGAHWEKDADASSGRHREMRVDFFKIDALKLESKAGEANLRRFFQKVARESNGKVTFDLDITAEKRFGYFGLIEAGPLFVENRYTDWHKYWPHHTLRVTWQLAHWVDPVRLRLEWLNNARHVEKYADDPLAPSLWAPDALFATVMFCAPLGWFEVSNLPENYFQKAAPLIQTWKKHRANIQNGTILPLGKAPDGLAWTGFVSLNEAKTGGYALIFRELNPASKWAVEVPFLAGKSGDGEVLGGEGAAQLENGILKLQVPEKLRFVWAKF